MLINDFPALCLFFQWFRTPLMQAAKSGMHEVCKLYIEHGAEVDDCTVVSGCCCLFLGGRGQPWGRGVGGSRRKYIVRERLKQWLWYNDQTVINPVQFISNRLISVNYYHFQVFFINFGYLVAKCFKIILVVLSCGMYTVRRWRLVMNSCLLQGVL